MKQFKKRGIKIETIQTDNGSEFTAHYTRNDSTHLSSFEQILKKFNIRHKRIKPYTPRHNGMLERSHREDQKRFYICITFYPFDYFRTQLKRYCHCSNRISMKPLGFLSPVLFLPQVANIFDNPTVFSVLHQNKKQIALMPFSSPNSCKEPMFV